MSIFGNHTLVSGVGTWSGQGPAISDWSSNAARRLQRNEDHVSAAAAQQEQQLLDLHAPRLWQELCSKLAELCSEFNAEPGMQMAMTAKSAEGQITNKSYGSQLYLNFDSKRHTVWISGIFATTYRIEFIAGTREVTFVDSDNMPVQVDEIAAKALNALV